MSRHIPEADHLRRQTGVGRYSTHTGFVGRMPWRRHDWYPGEGSGDSDRDKGGGGQQATFASRMYDVEGSENKRKEITPQAINPDTRALISCLSPLTGPTKHFLNPK